METSEGNAFLRQITQANSLSSKIYIQNIPTKFLPFLFNSLEILFCFIVKVLIFKFNK